MKQIFCCILLIVCLGCKKSGTQNVFRVIMNSSGNGFVYSIQKSTSSDPTRITLQSSITNVTSVDYSFTPQIGESIWVQVSSINFYNTPVPIPTVDITYKGQHLKASFTTQASTVTYGFYIPN